MKIPKWMVPFYSLTPAFLLREVVLLCIFLNIFCCRHLCIYIAVGHAPKSGTAGSLRVLDSALVGNRQTTFQTTPNNMQLAVTPTLQQLASQLFWRVCMVAEYVVLICISHMNNKAKGLFYTLNHLDTFFCEMPVQNFGSFSTELPFLMEFVGIFIIFGTEVHCWIQVLQISHSVACLFFP